MHTNTITKMRQIANNRAIPTGQKRESYLNRNRQRAARNRFDFLICRMECGMVFQRKGQFTKKEKRYELIVDIIGQIDRG